MDKEEEQLNFHVMIWKLLIQLHAKIMKFTALVQMIELLCQFRVKVKCTFSIKDVKIFLLLEPMKIGILYKDYSRMMLQLSHNNLRIHKTQVKWNKERSQRLHWEMLSVFRSHLKMTFNSHTHSVGDSILNNLNASLETKWKFSNPHVNLNVHLNNAF